VASGTNNHELTPEENEILEQIAQKGDPASRQLACLIIFWNQGLSLEEISKKAKIPLEEVQGAVNNYKEKGTLIFPTALVEDAVVALVSERSSEEKTKKQISPGVLADDPMSEAGRKVLRFHFERMLEHEAGTRLGEDIEALHDMRVATRRMRSAFNIFGPYFKRKRIKPFLKGLRRTGRILGRVRDLDVSLQKANTYLTRLSEDEKSALDPLLDRWRGKHEALRADLVTHLDSKRYKEFVDQFNTFLSTQNDGAKKIKLSKPNAYRVYQAVPILIYKRYGILRGYDEILEKAELDTLHALRIDVKRFRYLLEFVQEVLGPTSKDVIQECVIVQDHLGELNDADIACRILIDFLENWRKKHRREDTDISGVADYLVWRQVELRKLMDTFPATWIRFLRSNIRHKLADAISEL
jgi:CHAD domain-containing protein